LVGVARRRKYADGREPLTMASIKASGGKQKAMHGGASFDSENLMCFRWFHLRDLIV
jgi:hypothetical protein